MSEFDALFELGNEDSEKEGDENIFKDLSEEQRKVLIDKAETITQGLKKNRDEILQEKESEELKRKEAQEELDRINKEVEDAKQKLDESERLKQIENAQKGKDFESWKKLSQESFEREKDELEKKSQENFNRAEKLLQEKVDLTLSTAISKMNVSTEGFPGVQSLLRNRMTLSDKGAVLLEGAPLEEYLKTWADSDEGKFYIKAPLNGGSGSTSGSNTEVQGKTWKEMSLDEKASLRRSNPEKALELQGQA